MELGAPRLGSVAAGCSSTMVLVALRTAPQGLGGAWFAAAGGARQAPPGLLGFASHGPLHLLEGASRGQGGGRLRSGLLSSRLALEANRAYKVTGSARPREGCSSAPSCRLPRAASHTGGSQSPVGCLARGAQRVFWLRRARCARRRRFRLCAHHAEWVDNPAFLAWLRWDVARHFRTVCVCVCAVSPVARCS